MTVLGIILLVGYCALLAIVAQLRDRVYRIERDLAEAAREMKELSEAFEE